MLRNDLVTVDFGVPGVVQIKNNQADKTEIDMALPGVFCDAKLTEADFTHKRPEVVESYDGLHDAFHVSALPRVGADYDNYQIIRNLLAAKQHTIAITSSFATKDAQTSYGGICPPFPV